MKLYEMLKLAKYYQKVWIFEHNDFDQNMPIFKGIVDDARADKDKTFDFLMDDVECYDCTTGTLIIYVRNEYSDERMERHYIYGECWGEKIEQRPWRYSSEIMMELESEKADEP